jgi:phosphate-selective porin
MTQARVLPLALLLAAVAAPGVAAGADEGSAQPAASAPRRPLFTLKDHPAVRLGALEVEFRGKLDLDNPVPPPGIGEGSTIEIGRQRLGVSGQLYNVIEFEIEREVERDDAWRDVHAQVRVSKFLAVRGGKFKAPFSRAQTTSSTKLDFVHRPLAAEALAPGRQVGVMAEGRLFGRTATVEAGYFREREAEGTAPAAVRFPGRPMAAARVTVRPFRGRDGLLEGLEGGVAVTSGLRSEGLTSVSGETFADGQTFFPHVWIQGRRLRLGYEASWSAGPFTAAGEFIRVEDERLGQGVMGDALPPLVGQGWYVTGTWAAFGRPRARRLPIAGGTGALELAFRVDELRFGSHAPGEPAFAHPRAAHVLPNADRAVTAGVNYYFSRFARIQVNVIGERVADASRSPVGTASRFWSAVTRLQLHL